jgi:hypothetical protein
VRHSRRPARPGGHAASATLPRTCKAASPAPLVLFAAAHTRVSTARRRAVLARWRGLEGGAGTEPARRGALSRARGMNLSADEPGQLIPGHPKPYRYIRRCQRDAFLRQRKASCEMPACELHHCERGSRSEILRPTLEAVGGGFFDILRRGDRALPPTRPGLPKNEAGFVFSKGYGISGGKNRGIQTEFWPFPPR